MIKPRKTIEFKKKTPRNDKNFLLCFKNLIELLEILRCHLICVKNGQANKVNLIFVRAMTYGCPTQR
jgi:hypothetical protein